MALCDDFIEKDSEEDAPGVRWYVSLSPGLHKSPPGMVIRSDLISLLCCFHWPGRLVTQSLSYLASLNALVVKERGRQSLSLLAEVTLMINEQLVHRNKIDYPCEPVWGTALCL